MKLPGVSGVYDYAGPSRNLRYRSRPCCLPPYQKRRRPDCIFSELNTQPTCTPVYASPHTSRCATQNSGPSGSLLLSRRTLSSLLHAGLCRRTGKAILLRTDLVCQMRKVSKATLPISSDRPTLHLQLLVGLIAIARPCKPVSIRLNNRSRILEHFSSCTPLCFTSTAVDISCNFGSFYSLT